MKTGGRAPLRLQKSIDLSIQAVFPYADFGRVNNGGGGLNWVKLSVGPA
jgi:hypothetical protein